MRTAVLLFSLESLGQYVVTWSWQLAVFIAFVGFLLRCDRRHRPEWRHRVLVVGLVLSLILPLLINEIAAFYWTSQVKSVLLEPKSSPLAPVVYSTPGLSQPETSAPVRAKAIGTTSVPSSVNPYTILGFIWCVGITLAILRKAHEYRRLRGVVRRAVPAPAADEHKASKTLITLLSDQISSPMLYGTLRPVILLPRDIQEWSSKYQLATIIRHEWVHFTRSDHWISVLEGVLRALLFFHPFVRWMCHQLDVERELACDAEMLRTGTNPEGYAETLLLVAEHAVASNVGIPFAAAAQLNQRIEFLFRSLRRSRVALIAGPVLLLTPLLAIGFSQAPAEAIPQLESLTLTRLLPGAPVTGPLEGAATASSSSRRSPQAPSLQQEPTPAGPLSSLTEIAVFRGQGEMEKVRVTIGLPFNNLTFRSRVSPSGTEGLEVSARLEGMVSLLSGKVVARFDDPLSLLVPKSSFRAEGVAVFPQDVSLPPGIYRLFLVLRDDATGDSSISDRRLEVPRLSGNTLSTSSLVLAELIDVLPPQTQGAMFQVGTFRVRPNVTGKYRRSQPLNIFQEAYSDAPGPLTMSVLITTEGKEFKRSSEELIKSSNFTFVKTLPLSDFIPGRYEIQTTVTDPANGLSAVSRAHFVVE